MAIITKIREINNIKSELKEKSKLKAIIKPISGIMTKQSGYFFFINQDT